MVMLYYDPNDPASVSGTLSGHNVAVTPVYNQAEDNFTYQIHYDSGFLNTTQNNVTIPSVPSSTEWGDINQYLTEQLPSYAPNKAPVETIKDTVSNVVSSIKLPDLSLFKGIPDMNMLLIFMLLLRSNRRN